MWRDVPFACQRRPIVGVLRMCWLLLGSFDCFCCPHTSVHRPSIACLAVFLCGPGALFLHALSGPSTTCPFPPHGWSAPDGLPLALETPGVVKQDKSSGGSVDTINTRSVVVRHDTSLPSVPNDQNGSEDHIKGGAAHAFQVLCSHRGWPHSKLGNPRLQTCRETPLPRPPRAVTRGCVTW